MDILPIWYHAGQHNEALSAFFQQLACDCGISQESSLEPAIYPLVGRDAVVAELCDHYSSRNPGSRWVSGVAGIGKTEVCREVIRRLAAMQPRFDMTMVDCTNADSPLRFFTAAAKACNVKIPDHLALNPAEFLAQALPEGRQGLYFDNFEDVWRGLDADGRHDLARWLKIGRAHV